MGGGGARGSSGGSSSRSVGDGGGRAANNGGMSRGSTSSAGGRTSNQASPGRSTPGSPNAADGRRGSTMGPSGGSAPANNASPSRSTPGSPNAGDDRRGATMGPSGGSAPSVAPSSNASNDAGMGYVRNEDGDAIRNAEGGYVMTPGGFDSPSANSDSITGASDARNSFSFNSESIRRELAEGDTSFRRAREQEARLDPNNAPMEGLIAPSLEGQNDGPGRDAPVGRPSVTSVADDQSTGDIAAFASDTLRSEYGNATDDGFVRNNVVTKVPVIGPLVEGLADMNDNRKAAENASESITNYAAQYGMTPSEAGVSTDTGLLSQAMLNAQVPFANAESILNRAVVGDVGSGFDNQSGGRGNVPNEPIPPTPAGQPNTPQVAQSGENQRGPFAGRMTNYGSYRRRFFSRV